MKSEESVGGRIIGVLAFVVGYWLITGGIDSHFWLPFIFILVVTMGWGNIHLGGKKKDSDPS